MSSEQLSGQWPGCLTRWLFTSVIASITAFASGCTTTRIPVHAEVPIHAERDSTLIEIRFEDKNGDRVSVGNRPTDSSLVLGAIAGSIGGNASQTLQVVRIGTLPSVQINLNALETAAAENAKPQVASFVQTGLHIDPVDTRFLRVSTLLASPGDSYVGFIDPESKNELLLMYFDRPCRVTGVAAGEVDGEMLTLTYDVTVKTAGLVWIVRSSSGSNGFVARVARETIGKMLVVGPPD